MLKNGFPLIAVFVALTVLLPACRGDGAVDRDTPAATGTSSAAAAGKSSARPVEPMSAPPDAPATDADGYAPDSAFEAKRKELAEKLGPGFAFKICKPFLIVSNQSGHAFNRSAGTVQYGMKAYYNDYIKKKPDYVLTVFLFADERSYRKWANELFGDTDVSHFGYYSPCDKALVMNIATGGGTLVHELFHALVEPEFPDIPSWVNEGIASLYEACRFVEPSSIRGMMNWRFPVLKKGLAAGHYVKLRDLFSTNTREFYADPHGMHYAEARYFCMWLEERGMLRKFYRSLLENHKTDRTGVKTIEKVMGGKIEDFEKKWRKWVDKQEYRD